jgi:hypothetical protein
MKKCYKNLALVVLLSFLFSFAAKAQADTTKANDTTQANAIRDKLITTICACVSQKDPSTIKTADDVQALVMNCFMGDGLSLLMDYAKASGIDVSNTDQMRSMGEKLGEELSLRCPTMMKMMMNVVKDSTEYNKLMPGNKKN